MNRRVQIETIDASIGRHDVEPSVEILEIEGEGDIEINTIGYGQSPKTPRY